MQLWTRTLMPHAYNEDPDQLVNPLMEDLHCQDILLNPMILYMGNEDPDQTAQLGRLIRVFTALIWHNSPFSTMYIIYILTRKLCSKVKPDTMYIVWHKVSGLKYLYNKYPYRQYNCIVLNLTLNLFMLNPFMPSGLLPNLFRLVHIW